MAEVDEYFEHVEAAAKKQAEGYVVQAYEVDTDEFFWCYGTMHIRESAPLRKALGLPMKWEPTHPRHLLKQISWEEFKAALKEVHNG